MPASGALNRRGALTLLALTLLHGCAPPDVDRRLVVVSYGGTYQNAQRKAFFEAFAKRYNVFVREETWTGDFNQLKSMVESGDVTWDVVDVEGYMVLRGAAQDLLEKVDYTKVPKDELLPDAVNDYGVASNFWSTVLAYSTNAYSVGKQPVGWTQFWDVMQYPGTRALRKDPVANLEIALLASGVPRDQLYPLDIDRAFQSLDKIKPYIKVWWETGDQPTQMLASGEAVMSSVWNGRVSNAAKTGSAETFDWEDGIVSSEWWVIPRGAKNKELAQDFLAFASSAEPQAELTNYIPYGPVNRKAIESIPPDVLKNIPSAPDNLAKQVFVDSQWWNSHQAEIAERWNKWLAQ